MTAAKRRKGKYDDALPGLQKLPPENAPYQERVERAKEELFSKMSVTDLALEYAGLRREKERLEAEESALNLRIAACSQLLIASQEAGAEGWGQYGVADNALRLASGATIRVKAEPYGRVVDKVAFRQWCVDNGYEMQLQLWPSTMNAIAKERLVDGQPPPDGVEVFRKDSLVFVESGLEGEE